MKKPLNGEKTHPLTAHAIAALGKIAHAGQLPPQEINPGVVDRLIRGNLVEIIDHPSPYRTHRGRPISHLRLTDDGKAMLAKD